MIMNVEGLGLGLALGIGLGQGLGLRTALLLVIPLVHCRWLHAFQQRWSMARGTRPRWWPVVFWQWEGGETRECAQQAQGKRVGGM